MDKPVKIAGLPRFIQQLFIKSCPHIGNGRHAFTKNNGYPFHRNSDFGQVTKPEFLFGNLRVKKPQTGNEPGISRLYLLLQFAPFRRVDMPPVSFYMEILIHLRFTQIQFQQVLLLQIDLNLPVRYLQQVAFRQEQLLLFGIKLLGLRQLRLQSLNPLPVLFYLRQAVPFLFLFLLPQAEQMLLQPVTFRTELLFFLTSSMRHPEIILK